MSRIVCSPGAAIRIFGIELTAIDAVAIIHRRLILLPVKPVVASPAIKATAMKARLVEKYTEPAHAHAATSHRHLLSRVVTSAAARVQITVAAIATARSPRGSLGGVVAYRVSARAGAGDGTIIDV